MACLLVEGPKRPAAWEPAEGPPRSRWGPGSSEPRRGSVALGNGAAFQSQLGSGPLKATLADESLVSVVGRKRTLVREEYAKVALDEVPRDAPRFLYPFGQGQ